jgi:hypothetical protein
LTANIDPWIIDMIKKDVCYHHWILYDRTRTDDIDKQAESQHKTGTEDRDEAIRVLVGRGFLEIGMSIDDEKEHCALSIIHYNFTDNDGQDCG